MRNKLIFCNIKEFPIFHAGTGKIDKAFIITDENVAKYYLCVLENNLSGCGVNYKSYIIPAGEQSKNYETAQLLIEKILYEGATRGSFVIGLGGGVIGDLSGFVASLLLRGVRLIHIPTTLVAQVDSSIGGKTAINSESGKNLIGTLYDPDLIIIDVTLLRTLSQNLFISGISEVIKYGVVCDSDFFYWLESNYLLILAREENVLLKMIKKSCKIKLDFVLKDRKEENGHRILLNFGHTFAHALEAASCYCILHGHAVAVGMIIAMRISCCLGYISGNTVDKIVGLIEKFKLPTKIDDLLFKYDQKSIIKYLSKDKKNVLKDDLCMVLINSLGRGFVCKNIQYNIAIESLNK